MSKFRELLMNLSSSPEPPTPPTPPTPTPYTELNYIQAQGNQTINTGIIPTAETRVVLDFSTNNLQFHDYSVFAIKWDIDGFVLLTEGNILRWHNSNNTFYDLNYTLISGQRLVIDVYKNQISINGTQILDKPYSTLTYSNPIKLLAFNTQYPSYCSIYSCKIYDNNVLVRDYIPVLDENNTPCLYDKVSQTYFYNTGTGTFNYG